MKNSENDKSKTASDSLLSGKAKLIAIKKQCKSTLKKLLRKSEKQQEELENAGKWLWYQQIGDSLLAKLAEISKGITEITLKNIHSGQSETIKMNPKLNALGNANLFFKKAKKGKRGFEICQKQLKATNEEIKAVEQALSSCQNYLGLEEPSLEWQEKKSEIETFIENALKNEHSNQTDKKEASPTVPYRHLTIKGWEIFIGKNTRQNDEISIRFAKPSYIWMHVAAHAGSHCVIRRGKNDPWPPKEVLEQVAALAVWFSKAKHTSYAEVHVTEARYVRKPRKSPPGEVVISQYKTLRVSPKSPQELFKEER